MALDVKLELIRIDYLNNRYFLRDITGEYSASNTGGYGTPNPSRVATDAEISSFSITITRPDNTSFTTDVSNQSYKDPQAGSIITEYTITDSLSLQDGNYSFKLTVNEDGGELDSDTITTYSVDLLDIKSKINSQILKELDFCTDLLSDCSESKLLLWSYYKGLEAAIDNEDNTKTDYLLTKINALL